MTCLVKCERPLVLEDASRAVQHAAVRALGRRLHALLGDEQLRQSSALPTIPRTLTTLTISNGWPTSTCPARSQHPHTTRAAHAPVTARCSPARCRPQSQQSDQSASSTSCACSGSVRVAGESEEACRARRL